MADSNRLLSDCPAKSGTQGSNPCLSANFLYRANKAGIRRSPDLVQGAATNRSGDIPQAGRLPDRSEPALRHGGRAQAAKTGFSSFSPLSPSSYLDRLRQS